jgi:hypothetical protein
LTEANAIAADWKVVVTVAEATFREAGSLLPRWADMKNAFVKAGGIAASFRSAGVKT